MQILYLICFRELFDELGLQIEANKKIDEECLAAVDDVRGNLYFVPVVCVDIIYTDMYFVINAYNTVNILLLLLWFTARTNQRTKNHRSLLKERKNVHKEQKANNLKLQFNIF